MGYLNNQVVTVDAILTTKGRELLARGDGSFNITQFALSDDEIDYTLYNPNHPSGSAYYGEAIENIEPGKYFSIKRTWKTGDKIVLTLDLRGKLIQQNNYQAIVRGPIVLARDTRFNDGFVDEAAEIKAENGYIKLTPAENKPENIWMAFTAPLVLGTDLEGEFRKPKQINFCDFSSAGNTWEQSSRYRVWIPQTLNAMKMNYKKY